MAKADESKSKSAEGAPQQYNPHTAKWEAVEDEARIAEHEAQRDGKPAPGDRTEDELRSLEGGAGAPVLTTIENTGSAASTTDTSGGAGGATGAGDTGNAGGGAGGAATKNS